MTEPLVASVRRRVGATSPRCATASPTTQWDTAHRVPGLDGARQRRAHDRHRAHAARRAARRAAGRRTVGAHVRNDIGKANEQWIAGYRAMRRRRSARRVPRRHAAPARRVARAERPTTGTARASRPKVPGRTAQFMAIRVFDCWYHDQDIREALDRPGYLEGPVADLSLGRIPREGARRTSSARRPARRPTARWCSTSRARRRSSPRCTCRPKGRAVLLDAPPDAPTVALTHRPAHVRPARGRPVER